MPRLILFPSCLSQEGTKPYDVLPAPNIAMISEVKHFLVENIRSARRFLKQCNRDIDIDSLTLTVLNVDTPAADIPAMLAPMAEGHDMGIISEAGCPAIADPGALAVAEAQRRGYDVVPLVGPSSIILSLMASGFNGQSFAFHGYLPIDHGARTEALKRLYREAQSQRRTQIFIETPYRNNRLVADIVATLPPQALLCVASDITGPRQSIITRPLSKWRTATLAYDKIPTIFLLAAP